MWIPSLPPPSFPPLGAFVLLRVYAYDKQTPNKTDIWGAVAPPIVKYKVGREGGREGGKEEDA